jgi:hypothetical protein
MVMASQDGEFRTRAADEVGKDFQRQSTELLQGQRLQFSASWKHRARELESYAANRAEAIRQHADRVKAIDEREKSASIDLSKKHNSIGGRLSGLTRTGRARQEQERQGLAEKFENQRMKQHRDLAALQERQTANEQKARERYGQEHKAMREGHLSARSTQRDWQDKNRDRLTQDRVSAYREAATRALFPERQKAQEREPPTRAFNR